MIKEIRRGLQNTGRYIKEHPKIVATRIGIAGALGAGSILFASACGDQRPPVNPTPILPVAAGSPIPESSTEYLSWLTHPAIERIRMLEMNHPDIQGLKLDVVKELTSATAQFFYEKIKPPLSAKEMEERVTLADKARFISDYENSYGVKITSPAQREQILRMELFEGIKADKVIIDLNISVLKAKAQDAIARPKLKEEIGDRDPNIVSMKDALFTAYLLLNRAKEESIDFPTIKIRINNQRVSDTVNINSMADGLIFYGTTAAGNKVTSSGFLKSLVEFLTEEIDRESESSLYLKQSMSDGSALIRATHEIASIDIKLATDVLFGRIPANTYFEALGKATKSPMPNDDAGRKLMSVVSMVRDGALSIFEFQPQVDKLLNTPTLSTPAKVY